MTTKRRLLLTICSICLVAVVAVLGVFAFSAQSFSISARVFFEGGGVTAKDVEARVSLEILNQYVSVYSNPSALIFTKDEDATPKSIIPPDVTFKDIGEENAITYRIEVINNSLSSDLIFSMSDTTMNELATLNSSGIIRVIVKYIINDFDREANLSSVPSITIPASSEEQINSARYDIIVFLQSDQDFVQTLNLNFQLTAQ